MARTLSAQDLASESGTSVELIDRLVAIGALKPTGSNDFQPGDVVRIETVQAFLDAGLTMGDIAASIQEGPSFSRSADGPGRAGSSRSDEGPGSAFFASSETMGALLSAPKRVGSLLDPARWRPRSRSSQIGSETMVDIWLTSTVRDRFLAIGRTRVHPF